MMVNLSAAIARTGMAVDLVLVRREGPYLSDVPSSVRIVELGTGRVVRSVPALVGYLRRERPIALLSTLVHVNVAAILAGCLARSGTRIVVREANYVSLARSADRQRLERLAYRAMPWIYRFADAHIAISRGVGEDLERVCRMQPGSAHVIRNPVITPEIMDRAQEPVDHPWLQAGEPPIVLGLGRFVDQKDLPSLIHAFSVVRRDIHARLVILGEGAGRVQLEQLVRDLGLEDDVALPGFVDNPFAWMSRAAVFAQSSRFEGSGNALVEAMACGTPVISTDCPSGPREILEDGKFGTLVEVGDREGLARAITNVLLHPPSTEPARNRAMEFDADRVARQYMSVMVGEYHRDA